MLRGPRLRPGVAALRHALEVRYSEHHPPEGVQPHRTEAARRLSPERLGLRARTSRKAEAALLPLERIAIEGGVAHLADLVEAHAPLSLPSPKRQG